LIIILIYECFHSLAKKFCTRDILVICDNLISSSFRAQQGDPCGPMIFSLAILPIILSLVSQLNIWYLDDGTPRSSFVRL
jgi:hypothetical protein